MKSDQTPKENEELLSNSREAAEAAIAAAKYAGSSTWEQSAKRLGGSIQQWDEAKSGSAPSRKVAKN